MGFIISNTGITAAIETNGYTNLGASPLYTEAKLLPKVEMDKADIKPQSLFNGMNDSLVIPDWAKVSQDIELPLPTTIGALEVLFAISNLKKTSIFAAGASGLGSDDDVLTGTNGSEIAYMFTPWTKSKATASLDMYTLRSKYKLSGAKSSFSLSGKVGDKITIKFAAQGGYVGVDAKNSADADYDIPAAPRPNFCILKRLDGITADGIGFEAEEFAFDMKSTLTQIKTSKTNAFSITAFEPNLNLKVKLTEANEASFQPLLDGTTVSIKIQLTDGNGNQKWLLIIPKAKLSKQPDYGDTSGIWQITQDYNAMATNGDDNFKLIYIK